MRFVLAFVVFGISLFASMYLWWSGGLNRKKPTVAIALGSMLFEGHELHASLRTRQLESIRDLPTGVLLSENPSWSTDDAFVEAISRGGSQGRLGGVGMRSALYARYANDKNEVGCCGLEAASDADADMRETAIREIWAHNARQHRASVYRKDRLLFVIWNDGVSEECWQSVNANVAARLGATSAL